MSTLAEQEAVKGTQHVPRCVFPPCSGTLLRAQTLTFNSQGELMTMVRFGADEIFRAKDEGVTEEDIDLILQEVLTRQSMQKKRSLF